MEGETSVGEIRESDGDGYRHGRLGWIRRKDICNREGDVYLTRWTILQAFGWALMLHCMRRPDQDRCLHDHPWKFVTLVLRGGYEEEVAETESHSGPIGTLMYTRWNPPGTLLYRPAMHTHRVSRLPHGPCWTLVLRSGYVRTWGFRNERGEWRRWDRFVDWAGSVLWCDERPDGTP